MKPTTGHSYFAIQPFESYTGFEGVPPSQRIGIYMSGLHVVPEPTVTFTVASGITAIMQRGLLNIQATYRVTVAVYVPFFVYVCEAVDGEMQGVVMQ